MSTTTIRLPKELKDRVTLAAKRAGTTVHAFLLEAIAEKTEQDELQAEFRGTAEQRDTLIVATGKAVEWGEMRRYLERRVVDKKAAAPKPRPVAR